MRRGWGQKVRYVPRNQGNHFFLGDFAWISRRCPKSLIQGKMIYTPPPPPHFWLKGIFEGRGVGVYILRPHAAGILYAPLFYTPPTPRRVFSGVGGWGVYKIWPRICVQFRSLIWGTVTVWAQHDYTHTHSRSLKHYQCSTEGQKFHDGILPGYPGGDRKV